MGVVSSFQYCFEFFNFAKKTLEKQKKIWSVLFSSDTSVFNISVTMLTVAIHRTVDEGRGGSEEGTRATCGTSGTEGTGGGTWDVRRQGGVCYGGVQTQDAATTGRGGGGEEAGPDGRCELFSCLTRFSLCIYYIKLQRPFVCMCVSLSVPPFFDTTV